MDSPVPRTRPPPRVRRGGMVDVEEEDEMGGSRLRLSCHGFKLLVAGELVRRSFTTLRSIDHFGALGFG